MLQHGISLHDWEAVIRWYWLSSPLGDHDFTNTVPWDWVDQRDKGACQADIGVALLGVNSQPKRYRLDRAKFGAELVASVRINRTNSRDMPLLCISYIFPALVAGLSGRERDVAKLLPLYASKEIAKELKISPSTVETIRQRLSAKVGLSGHALVSWCAEHREVI